MGEVRQWWERRPPEAHGVLVAVLVLIPLVLDGFRALGLNPWSQLALLGIPAWIALLTRMSRSDSLTDAQFVRCGQVVLTGVASGDPAVDREAERRLSRLAVRRNAHRLVIPLVLTLAVLVPVASAWRAGSAWWLLPEFCVIAAAALLRWDSPDARTRLDQLRAQAPDGIA